MFGMGHGDPAADGNADIDPGDYGRYPEHAFRNDSDKFVSVYRRSDKLTCLML